MPPRPMPQQQAPTAAPQQPAGPATASIEGQVFHGATGAPLKRASVRLVGIGRRQQSGGMPSMLTKETDDAGRFSFTSLEAGRYSLSAERQGFLRQNYGGRKYNTSGVPLAIGVDQHVKDVVFKLSPQSVITGKVLDEDGEPVANVQVRAFVMAYRGGKKQWSQTGSGQTSDIGEYRIPNLEPGRYLVATNAPNRNNGMMQTSTNEPLPDGPELRYAATYYPSTVEEVSAVPIDVGPGGELRGIDIRLVKTRVFRIRGRVMAENNARNMPMVMLMSKDGMQRGGPNMSPARQPDYKFEIRGVTPGSYVVYAQLGQQAVAFQPVEVRGNHIDGIVLTPAPGSDVTGTIKVTDANAPVDVSNVSVMLRATGAQFNGPPRGKTANGAFTIKNVLPMRYTVAVNGLPDGCFVKSVQYGGRDIPEDGVDLTGGGTIDVVLSATAGEISAAVVDKDGKGSPGATVALVAKDGGKIQGNSTDENGAVSFHGLKPGEYVVIAWEDIPQGASSDPDFVKQYEGRGTTVKLDPSGKQSAQVKVVPAE